MLYINKKIEKSTKNMSETLETLFIRSFDNKLSIIDDGANLSSDFKKLLAKNNIFPNEDQLRFLFPNVEDEEKNIVDEHCNDICDIFTVNNRLFQLNFLDNGEEFYSAELVEVVAVTKTITAYEAV